MARSAPWLSELVDCKPLEFSFSPGHPVSITGAELARHAGLSEVGPARGFPAPGEMAGLVILSSVQATAYVALSPFAFNKLRAHQLTSVQLVAGAAVELSAPQYKGKVQLWVCRAVKGPLRALDGHCEFPLREDGGCLDEGPMLHRIEFPMR